MRQLLKEPLLHFLLAGGLIFAVYGWLDRSRGERAAEARPEVRIGEGDVRWLALTWSRQWQRQPTREELRGLVADLVREQLLAREAQALGLDEGDTVVRRRLAQKLEFLVQDTAVLADPGEEELRRFYAAHPERFQSESRITFTHVFFSAERREDAAGDAKAALAQLSVSPDPASHPELGDPLLVETEIRDADARAIGSLLGPAFAEAVVKLEPGRWTGPIASAYGVHLVRVAHIEPAATRPFADARVEALARWRAEREREAQAEYFAGLLEKYDVVMDERVEAQLGPLAPLDPTARALPARIDPARNGDG